MREHKLIAGSLFVLAAGLALIAGPARAADTRQATEDFSFIQLSDVHWGYNKPEINPDWGGTLKKIIAQVNSLEPQPDFVVFTGDLTQTTEDPQLRRKRMQEFRAIIADLKVKDVKFLPGEHDAGLDDGEAFKENFGATHYTFDHKGVHFIALDNVSRPDSTIGEEELKWLSDDLSKLDKSARIVVLTHRPLFALYPDWDWWTRDGDKAIELLKPFKNVAVFYGHIHQLNEHLADQVAFHAAQGMMYPLPAAGSVPKKAPVAWDPAQPYKGLGFRGVLVKAAGEYVLTEYPVVAPENDLPVNAISADDPPEVIKITAQKFEYKPNVIRIKKGVPVILEFTSLDQLHGFSCPALDVRTDIRPGETARVNLTAEKTGSFEFHCDNFCGEGHGDMTGTIIVEE